MTWTAPKTFVANDVLLSSELNTYLRDNLLELSPAKATTPGSMFVTIGPNLIAERVPTSGFVATAESTSSTSYTDLTTVGPSVTVETTSNAFVMLYCHLYNSTGVASWMSYAVPATATVLDSTAVMLQKTGGQRAMSCLLHASLTPGTNTFVAKYRVTGGSGTFSDRRIAVLPF